MRVSFAVAAALAGLPVVASSAEQPNLDEVVVTARQREENLQSVPAAISAISGELLDNSNSVNTLQLAQLVPSLYYNSANPRNTAYTIRGLGSNTLSVSDRDSASSTENARPDWRSTASRSSCAPRSASCGFTSCRRFG